MQFHPSYLAQLPTQSFNEQYRCYPIAMLPGPTSSRSYADHGSKIFLAPSALDKLTRLHITYPMLFSLINGAVVDEATALPKTTNAGVLEFTAEEGKVYLPYWVRFLSPSLSFSPFLCFFLGS